MNGFQQFSNTLWHLRQLTLIRKNFGEILTAMDNDLSVYTTNLVSRWLTILCRIETMINVTPLFNPDLGLALPAGVWAAAELHYQLNATDRCPKYKWAYLFPMLNCAKRSLAYLHFDRHLMVSRTRDRDLTRRPCVVILHNPYDNISQGLNNLTSYDNKGR